MLKKSALLGCVLLGINVAHALPTDFVYLDAVDPSIQQDIRYAGIHNFVGEVIDGYEAPTCILTVQAATALSKAQAALRPMGLGLKVYDCYRPQSAVNEFMAWSEDPEEDSMKAEFYPHVNKADVFKLGYVASPSTHSRGSTVDVTLVMLPTPMQPIYQRGEPLVSCTAPVSERYADNSVDMGTGFDCMDPLAHGDSKGVSLLAQQNRMLLQSVMVKNGFVPYADEWWHFTLKNEPYPNTYFNFPVE